MKKIILLLSLVFLASFAFSATEVQCQQQSAGVFTGKFDIQQNSFCYIPVQGGVNSKIKIEVGEGKYTNSADFHFPVKAFLFIDSSLMQGKDNEFKLDCSSGFFGWGNDLDIMRRDDFPYVQGCGDFGKDFITLTIDKPEREKVVPFAVYSSVKVMLSDNIVGNYLSQKLKNVVNELDSGLSTEFSINYPDTQKELGSLAGTNVEVKLISADYAKETASFMFTDKKAGKSLCDITVPLTKSGEGSFADCKTVNIKIAPKNGNPVFVTPEESGKELVVYYFKVEIVPKDVSAIDSTQTQNQPDSAECSGTELKSCTTSQSCPGTQSCVNGLFSLCQDIPNDGCPAGTTNATETESQTQLNSLIKQKYFGEIFNLKQEDWPQ